MPYLLDTNAWITIVKRVNTPILSRLASHQSDEIVTCAVVKAELLLGAEKYGNRAARLQLIDDALGPLQSYPFDDFAAAKYATIRHKLETLGQVIGPYDMQIAAICLAHDCTLVSSNVGEFSRVQGLALEDWSK